MAHPTAEIPTSHPLPHGGSVRTLPNTILRLLAVGILTATGIGTAGEASAATPTSSTPSQSTLDALEKAVFSSPDPASAFKHLTPAQQDIVHRAETPSGKMTSTTSIVGLGTNKGKTFGASPNVDGCWDRTDTLTTYALLGNWITKSHESLEVCYQSSIVTLVAFTDVWPDGAWGWSMGSHTEATKNWLIRGEGVSQQHWSAPTGDNSTICPLMWEDAGGETIQNQCNL